MTKKEKWIEINSPKDLPKSKNTFCWWVNRQNGYMFPDAMKSMILNRSLIHTTFSHYMPIENIPTPPKIRKKISQKEVDDTMNKLMNEKIKNLSSKQK